MSSVTAVPLHPLPKGTVTKLWLGLVVLVLLGIGLAWLGTSKLQYATTDTGVRYRVIEEGKGDAVTPDDLVQLHFEISRANGEVLESTVRGGQPVDSTVNSFPLPGLRSLLLVMKEGGIYQAMMTPEQATGRPIPAGAPVTAGEQLKFQFRVMRIAKGMGAMQEMMGPGAGGPGGPGGVPPGAMPPGAMPPGELPPGVQLPPAPGRGGR